MVYSSVASHSYFALNVNQAYLDDTDCFHCGGTGSDMQDVAVMMHEKWKNGTLDRLENEDCIDRYGRMIQSNYRHVLLVSSNDHTEAVSDRPGRVLNGTHVFQVTTIDAGIAEDQTHAATIYDWICSQSNTTDYYEVGLKDPSWCANKLDGVKRNASSWTVQGYPVEYCLRQVLLYS
jgi:hypothetical protein